jgi:hypothetical protein
LLLCLLLHVRIGIVKRFANGERAGGVCDGEVAVVANLADNQFQGCVHKLGCRWFG